ncbi:putative transcription factor B3-Domain family [Helianthus anomalus]
MDILRRNYHNWVANFNLAPYGMVQIITTDRRTFTVRVRKAGSSYFFNDEWFKSLLLPNKSLLLFQYGGSLTFRLIYFYQDLALAQDDFLYCQTPKFSEHKDHLLIDRFFVHHKLKNIIPTNHVTITTYPNRTWLVFMKKHGQNYYMTIGWKQIKEEMKIKDEHYIIFDMISESKFETMVFKGTKDLVRIPQRRLARAKVEVKQEVNEDGVA